MQVNNEFELEKAIKLGHAFRIEKIERLVCSSGENFPYLCDAIKKNWSIRRIVIKPDLTDVEIGMLLASLNKYITKIVFPVTTFTRLINNNNEDLQKFLSTNRSGRSKEISLSIQKTESNIQLLLDSLMISGFVSSKYVDTTLKIVTLRKLTDEDLHLLIQAMSVMNINGIALVLKSDINSYDGFHRLCEYIIKRKIRKVRFDLFSHRWELLRSIVNLVQNNYGIESFTYKTRYSDTNCDNLERLFGDDFSGDSMKNLRALCLDTGLLFAKGDSFLNLYKIVQHNRLEKLTLLRVTEAVKVCDHIHDMLVDNSSLTSLYMTVDYEKPERRPSLFGNMPGCKFLIDLLAKKTTIVSMYACENIAGELDYRSMQDLVKRNRRIQNTKVTNIIILLFNIFRNVRSGVSLLPVETWKEIFWFVQYDGISLDFSAIVYNLISDVTIRRVI